MIYCDYHLHSEFSFDSTEKIENICAKAVASGIDEITITDHVEFPQMAERPWPDFDKRDEVLSACRKKYQGSLAIHSGMELGQPLVDLAACTKVLEENKVDFLLASFHDVSGYPDPHGIEFTEENFMPFFSDCFRQMLEMASVCDFDVLGHLTYLFRFVPEELVNAYPPEFFRDFYVPIFKALIERGKGIEVNCSGLRMPSIKKTLPSFEILKLYKSCGGSIVTVGSDGHSCRSAFSGLEEGRRVLKEAGFDKIATFNGRELSFCTI